MERYMRPHGGRREGIIIQGRIAACIGRMMPKKKPLMVEAHMSEKKRASCLGDTLYIMESYSSSIKK